MEEYKVPRTAFALILLSQAFIVLPHLIRFPQVILPIWLITTLWRLNIFRGRFKYPGISMKLGLVLLGITLITIFYRSVFKVEVAVLFLLVVFLIKLIEMREYRDVLIVVFLSYFVIVAEVLFSQSLYVAIYLFISVILVTSTLVAVNYPLNIDVDLKTHLNLGASITLLSLPLMLLGFVVFPRTDPFWAMPMPSDEGQTGVSEWMEPGLIADLTRSDKLVMRAEFNGQVPNTRDLYWRGIVLSQFDGKRWTRYPESRMRSPNLSDLTINKSDEVRYTVIMEPTYRRYIFNLRGTVEAGQDTRYLRDFTQIKSKLIMNRMKWDAISYPGALIDKDRPYRYHFSASTSYPKYTNKKTQAFVAELRASYENEKEFIEALLTHFREQPFYYTLSPPKLGDNSIDDFMFGTRQGFCEHYASAFVFMSRVGGVPARVVTGYQGGAINDELNYVTVRQYDAHAWAEVWFEGDGWVRVDPTMYVAPERIENGSRNVFAQDGSFAANNVFSLQYLLTRGVLATVIKKFEDVNFLWSKFVLGYQSNEQSRFLDKIVGQGNIARLAMLVGGAMVSFTLVLMLFFYVKQRPAPMPANQKVYRLFCKKVAKKGLHRPISQGPMDFQREAIKYFPEHEKQIKDIINQYIALTYQSPDGPEYDILLNKFKRDVINFKL